jgi:hypothetical protein
MNGWYYDEQLNDPMTSITLHANKRLDDQFNWVDYKETDEDYYLKGDGGHGGGYGLEPIAKAILTEDFNIAVANTWSPLNGDDMISGIWSQIRTLAPYVPILGSALDIAEENTSEKSGNTTEGNVVSNGIRNVLHTIVKGAKAGLSMIDSRLNDHLITQGTRFTYYSGSGTAFGNLGLKYTIFPTFQTSGNFEDTIKQVTKLLPYVNGKFEKDNLSILKTAVLAWGKMQHKTQEWFVDAAAQMDEKIRDISQNKYTGNALKSAAQAVNKVARDLTDETISIADDIINEIAERGLIGWQKAPGGYKPTYKDIDTTLEGTLKLKLGPQFAVSSLLCQDASFNFSKVMVKNPFDGTISPLYCDINLTLTPATKYSNNALSDFISGIRNTRSNEAPEIIKKRLEAEKDIIKNNYKL